MAPARRETSERPGFVRLFWKCVLLALWSFVLWGTLFDLGLVLEAIGGGPRTVLRSLRTVPAEDALWAWANRIAGALAVLVWLAVLAGVWERARNRSSEGTSA
jgi:hypothetical protein